MKREPVDDVNAAPVRAEVDEQGIALLRIEALAAMLYFACYVAYLCWSLESEAGHWPSMVLIPLGLVLFHRIMRKRPRPIVDALASVGLRWGNLRTGVFWAILIGLGLSVFQAFFSRSSERVWELIQSGQAAFLLPLAFFLLLFTVGCTEEFLFRGVLQTRLTALLRSRVLGVLASSVLFGAYHVPYAYFHPRWPSHGDFSAAFMSAMGQGIAGGLIIGTLYALSRRNLVACGILHALIDTLPAITLIKINAPS